MRWYRMAAAGFVNVYDRRGQAELVAQPLGSETMQQVLHRARLEHGLENPEYAVFQTAEQAEEDARARGSVTPEPTTFEERTFEEDTI